MLDHMRQARIVITNYHAFRLRERVSIAANTRRLLQGKGNEPLSTLETEGQMLRRVMHDLMGMRNILVLNDEAHHCYREKPDDDSEERKMDREDRAEADKNSEAARVWISGIEAVKRNIGRALRPGPVGDAVLPARLRLPGGYSLRLDGKRLFADGRHRVGDREGATCSRGRQRSRRGRAPSSATSTNTSGTSCRVRGAGWRARSIP